MQDRDRDDMSSMKDRRSFFKKGTDKFESRRNREELSLSIRKSRRDGHINKKRNISFGQTMEDQDEIEAIVFDRILDEKLKSDLQSKNREKILGATKMLRRLLSREKEPPIDLIIENGYVPILVMFSSPQNLDEELLAEAMWAVTNIASGTIDQTKTIVDHGALDFLIAGLQHTSNKIRELSAWGLGNIAGDSILNRDYILNKNVLGILTNNIVNSNDDVELRKTSVWSASNLFRGKPFPNNHYNVIFPIFSELLKFQTEDIVADTLWMISYMSDCENADDEQRLHQIIQSKLIDQIVGLLTRSSKIKTPAVRCIGNFCSVNNELFTDVILKLNFLKYVPNLLENRKKVI
jgi:importin subunit alpha-2